MPRKRQADAAVAFPGRGPKYRKVEVSTWTDGVISKLSAPQPNAQTLWLFLLSGPRTTTFPGLVIARQAVLASDLGWSIEGLREAFAELVRNDLIEGDETSGVILLRKALFNGPNQDRISVRETARPESPNVIKSWAKSWSDVPDGELKTKYLLLLGAFAEALGEGYGIAYREAFSKALAKASGYPYPNPSGDPSRYPSSNQDQDQDQEQERDHADVSLAIASDSESNDEIPAAVSEAKPNSRDLNYPDRRGLVREIWQLHLDLFAMLKSEGIDGERHPPRAVHDAGEVELNARVSEMFIEFAHSGRMAESTRDRCLAALAIAGAEARKKRSLEWLDGGLWKSNRLANLLRKNLSSFPAATRCRFPWTTTAVEVVAPLPTKRTLMLNGQLLEVPA